MSYRRGWRFVVHKLRVMGVETGGQRDGGHDAAHQRGRMYRRRHAAIIPSLRHYHRALAHLPADRGLLRRRMHDDNARARRPHPKRAIRARTGPRAQASAIRDSLEYRIRATVSADLERMSLDEKLGQLFLIETGWQQYNADVDMMVRGMHAGAMIVYQQNMDRARPSCNDYIAAMQAHASDPPAGHDGRRRRRGGPPRLLGFDPPLPSAQDWPRPAIPRGLRQAGAQSAAELKALGINTDLAPVADVRTVPNAVEFTRIYGDDPATVVTLRRAHSCKACSRAA